MRKQSRYIIIFVILLLLFGCGAKEVVLTPEQEADRAYYEAKYVNAVAEMKFTQSLTKYNLWCSKEEYKEACDKVDPLWVKADTALGIWTRLVDSRKPSADSQANFQAELKLLKTALLMEMPNFNW